MSASWAKLESHRVNGTFPLQRCVGSSAHSGVFLTQSTAHAPSAAALRLVRFDAGSAPAQLSRWQAARELSHPHLVRIFEVGECRLEGDPYLFLRMEYADQTLAQVLERRALTDDEAREMLAPMLDALDYLHQRDLVHGGLKPSNVLVVGNQLKLASDCVRARDATDPDAGPAADVRALGVLLCQALTRAAPPAAADAGAVDLPAGLPASFSAMIARCLSSDPGARPTVPRLVAWLHGEAPELDSPLPPATRLVIRVALPGDEPTTRTRAVAERPRWRILPVSFAALALVALAWLVYRALPQGSDASPAATPAAATVEAPPPPPPPAAVVPEAAPPPPVAPAPAAGTPIDEVMPEVSRSALDTIRGTLRVSVRVSIGSDGTVTAASAEDPGPSRYFERRSLEAARKWTFVPAPGGSQPQVLLRFAFTRTGVTASAQPAR